MYECLWLRSHMCMDLDLWENTSVRKSSLRVKLFGRTPISNPQSLGFHQGGKFPREIIGSRFEPHWRPRPAKLPSFGGYSLETSPHLTSPREIKKLSGNLV